jgi:hypothetical protein
MSVLTIVSADVDQGRAHDLIAEFDNLLGRDLPDGILETRLVGDEHGHGRFTRCVETWRRSPP